MLVPIQLDTIIKCGIGFLHAKTARLDAPGALHHVMGWSIDGIQIFRNGKDRKDFLERFPIFVGQMP
jgi:hypothetical protein